MYIYTHNRHIYTSLICTGQTRGPTAVEIACCTRTPRPKERIMGVHVHVCVPMRVCAYVCVCAYACVCLCVCVRVPMRVCACVKFVVIRPICMQRFYEQGTTARQVNIPIQVPHGVCIKYVQAGAWHKCRQFLVASCTRTYRPNVLRGRVMVVVRCCVVSRYSKIACWRAASREAMSAPVRANGVCDTIT